MTIQEILDAVAELERKITDLPPGAPELPQVQDRITQLLGELERMRGVQAPLVPDASSPSTAEQKSVVELEEALESLRSAATSKKE